MIFREFPSEIIFKPETLEVDMLKRLCAIFGLRSSGDRLMLIKRLLDFGLKDGNKLTNQDIVVKNSSPDYLKKLFFKKHNLPFNDNVEKDFNLDERTINLFNLSKEDMTTYFLMEKRLLKGNTNLTDSEKIVLGKSGFYYNEFVGFYIDIISCHKLDYECFLPVSDFIKNKKV